GIRCEREGKKCFGEEIEEKIGSRKYDGIVTRIERELNGGERRVNGNQTGIKQKLNGRPR
ncbi:hypothetical protein ACIXJP_09590, partial [Bacteroides fragilis]